MKWLLSMVAATLMLCASAAAAGDLNGKVLADGCKKHTLERIACLAYIEGYMDGFVSNDEIMTTFLQDNVRSGHLTVKAEAERVDKPAYCVDDEIPAETVRDVYLGWADTHAEALDQPANSALFLALADAYPCSGPPAASGAYQAVSWRP
jgi:Rap1a immunity proteins